MRKDREITSKKEILQMLDKAEIIRLGLYDPELQEVYIVALNYGYSYEDDTLTFYLHGARQGRKYEIFEKNPNVGFEIETDIVPFVGPKPCLYGTAFKSIVGNGVITMLSDGEEKIDAMKRIMKAQTGKDFDFDERVLTGVRMFKLTVTHFTGKFKPVPPAVVKVRDDVPEGVEIEWDFPCKQ